MNCIPRARPHVLQGLLVDSSDNERGETLFLPSIPAEEEEGGDETEVQGRCEWEASEDNVLRVWPLRTTTYPTLRQR